MNTPADKTPDSKSQSVSANTSSRGSSTGFAVDFVDDHPEAVKQRKLQDKINDNAQMRHLGVLQEIANNSTQVSLPAQMRNPESGFNNVHKNQLNVSPTFNPIVQMFRSEVADRVEYVSRITNLVKSQNLSLALMVLDEAFKNGIFDGEDLSDIYDKLYLKQDFRGITWESFGVSISTDPKSIELDHFLDKLRNQIVDYRDKAPPEQGIAAIGPDVGFEEVVAGPGKKRIQVPSGSNYILLPLSSVRWSQSDVKAKTGNPDEDAVSLTDIVSHMARGGWRGAPAEVVKIQKNYSVSGVTMDLGMQPGYVSKDNRRLLCAFTAGLKTIPADQKGFNDRVPDYIDDKLKKHIWYDKTNSCLRFGNSGEGFNKKGQPTEASRWQLILKKGYVPVNYGELIIVRTANQPNVKATGTAFTIGGSDMPPYMKI